MRGFRGVLIVVLVLVALLAVVDRVGAWLAGRVVADQVAQQLTRYDVQSSDPDVSVGGFPFLTQVVAGEYRDVTVRLRDVGAAEVRLAEVDLTASDVAAPMSTLINRSGSIEAGTVEGTGVVGYPDVAARTGVDGLELAPGSGGAVAVRVPADVLGTTVVLTGSASVEVAGNAIRLRVTELEPDASGDVPAAAQGQIDQFASALSVDVNLPPLPYGLALESVRAEERGLAVTLSARDVVLAG